ncbi:redoxin domain-containing protein [Candidatus Gracilibacteria bacterium]|nr:redoxin domain-containing protein [Candidatus Gracilibacteria bacterium]
MNNYYSLLDVASDADQATIEAAYQRQRERYSPERVAEMDAELRAVAEERTAALDRAYSMLADPQRRRHYDMSIGLAMAEGAVPPVVQRGLSSRERWYAVGGAFAAIALIAVIWLFTGRGEEDQARAMGEVNRPAPALTLDTLGGGSIDLANYRGQVVLLNFWGTWCEPCRRELPAIQAAYDELSGQGLMVIGVNLTDDEIVNGETEADIAAFLAQYGVDYPTALDREGTVTNAYRVFPLPTSFFIDGNGQIRYVHIGELTQEDVRARFNELKLEAAGGSAE